MTGQERHASEVISWAHEIEVGLVSQQKLGGVRKQEATRDGAMLLNGCCGVAQQRVAAEE